MYILYLFSRHDSLLEGQSSSGFAHARSSSGSGQGYSSSGSGQGRFAVVGAGYRRRRRQAATMRRFIRNGKNKIRPFHSGAKSTILRNEYLNILKLEVFQNKFYQGIAETVKEHKKFDLKTLEILPHCGVPELTNNGRQKLDPSFLQKSNLGQQKLWIENICTATRPVVSIDLFCSQIVHFCTMECIGSI